MVIMVPTGAERESMGAIRRVFIELWPYALQTEWIREVNMPQMFSLHCQLPPSPPRTAGRWSSTHADTMLNE